MNDQPIIALYPCYLRKRFKFEQYQRFASLNRQKVKPLADWYGRSEHVTIRNEHVCG